MLSFPLIKTLKYLLSPRNPINSLKDAFRVHGEDSTIIIFALLASGFKRIVKSNSFDDGKLLPCPVGTFSNSLATRAGVCTRCPPGMQLVPVLTIVAPYGAA